MEQMGRDLLETLRKNYTPLKSKELTKEDIKFIIEGFEDNLKDINHEIENSISHITRASEFLAEEKKQQQQLQDLIEKLKAMFPEEEK